MIKCSDFYHIWILLMSTFITNNLIHNFIEYISFSTIRHFDLLAFAFRVPTFCPLSGLASILRKVEIFQNIKNKIREARWNLQKFYDYESQYQEQRRSGCFRRLPRFRTFPRGFVGLQGSFEGSQKGVLKGAPCVFKKLYGSSCSKPSWNTHEALLRLPESPWYDSRKLLKPSDSHRPHHILITTC